MSEKPKDFSTMNESGNGAWQDQTSPPTSLDVARLAKVSRATVSYVLNNVQNSRISEATRERVLQAAAELGYVPHEIASSLRSGRSDLVLLPFFDWPYNQSSITFLQEMALQLDKLGYTVMLRFFGRGDRKTLVRKIAAFHPVGVIFVDEEFSREDVEVLHRNGVRAILSYERVSTQLVPSISIDFSVVGELVGEHFVNNGHRHIAVIVPRDARILQLGLQRLHGLVTVGMRAGVTIERVDMGYDTDEAARLAATWKQGPRPSAVFTYNDEYGLLLMSALQDVGLQVPGDIALVGCDDLSLCEMLRPRLSSVNIAPGARAHDIAAYIDNTIQGQGPHALPNIPLACKIMIRESG
jgi:DNA-binding LacI/PurR family transcriptional regulator